MRRLLLLSSFGLCVTVGLAHPFDIDLSKVNVQSELKIKAPEIKKAAGEETVNKQGNGNNITSEYINKHVDVNLNNSTLRDDAKPIDRHFEESKRNTTLSDQKQAALRDNVTLFYNNKIRKNAEDITLKQEPDANKSLLRKQPTKNSVNDSKENYTKIIEQPEQKASVMNAHISIFSDAINLPVIQEDAPIDIPISGPETRISIFETVKEPHVTGGKLDLKKFKPAFCEGNNNSSENLALTVMKLQHKANTTDDNEALNSFKTEEKNYERGSKNETLVVAPISLGSNNISDIEKKPPTKIKFSLSEFRGAMKEKDSNKGTTNKTNLESVVREGILDKKGISVVVSADIDHVLNTTDKQKNTKHDNNSTTKDTAVDKIKPGSVLKNALDIAVIEEGEPVDIPIPRPGTQQAIYFNTVVEPKLRDSTLRAIDVVKADAAHEGIEIKDETSDVQKVVDTISKEKLENNLNRTSPSMSVSDKYEG